MKEWSNIYNSFYFDFCFLVIILVSTMGFSDAAELYSIRYSTFVRCHDIQNTDFQQTALSIMILSIKDFIVTLSITTPCISIECHYAERHYGEYRIFLLVC
jgi:hypothetical protein